MNISLFKFGAIVFCIGYIIGVICIPMAKQILNDLVSVIIILGRM